MTLVDLYNASCDIHTDTVFWIFDSIGDFYNYGRSVPWMITPFKENGTWLNTVGKTNVRRFKIDKEKNVCYVLTTIA